MRRTKEEAAKTRSRILRAALAEFSARGYNAARLEVIARRADVTRGAVYWHFSGKAALYQALLEAYSSRGDAIAAQAVGEGGSIREILERAIVRLLEAVERDPALRQAMELSLFKTERTPEVRRVERQRVRASQAMQQGIVRGLEEGVRRGELRTDVPPAEMARGMMALINGAIYLRLVDPSSPSLTESGPALAKIYLGGVSAKG